MSPHLTTSAIQIPRIPWELTDAVIDHLDSDFRMLGVCGMVCSEWLQRSRHHIFSTVQLWPWRVRNFVNLSISKTCTFSRHINRIEMDDFQLRDTVPDADHVQFRDAISLSQLPCLSRVESIQVRNVDWTGLPPSQQHQLRQRLAKFALLNRLEFEDVIFHDLREVVNIVNSFPLLKHLSANVTFMKYTEHAITSAATLRLPKNLHAVELGTDDGIPVFLSCIAAREADPHVERLNLRRVKVEHLSCIRSAIRKVGVHLKHLLLALDDPLWEAVSEDDFLRALKLSRLTQLRSLEIEGLRLCQKSSTLETTLPHLLSRLESPFLDTIGLSFTLHSARDIENFDWHHLQHVLMELHFFGLRLVNMKFHLSTTATQELGLTEVEIRKALRDLHVRGLLNVTVFSKKGDDDDDSRYEVTRSTLSTKL